MIQVKCDFCGKSIKKSEAEQSVTFVGFSVSQGEEIEEEIKRFYCSEQHKALYSFQEHLAFYGSREEALNHLKVYHGLINIRKLVKAFEEGDPLPVVEVGGYEKSSAGGC